MLDFDRASGIGGSDAAAVMGVSPWRDVTDVWMEKIRHPMWTPKHITPAMKWGTLLEPVLRTEYTADTGVVVVEYRDTIWSPNKVQFGHVDGLAVRPGGDREGVWEGKVSAMDDEWETGVPIYYQVQVQQYMGLVNLWWCDVSVLLPGGDFRTYRVEADPLMQMDIETEVLRLWNKYVLTKKPPGPVEAVILHPVAAPPAPKPKAAGPEQVQMVTRLLEIVAGSKALEGEEKRLKEALKLWMADAPQAAGPGWRIDFQNPKQPESIGWDMVATSLWNTLECVRREGIYGKDVEVPENIARYLDPGLFSTLQSLYTTRGKLTRPFVLRSVKEDAK